MATTRPRLRRVASCSVSEQASRQDNREQQARPDHPCHQHADSLFTSSSEFTNFRGLVNLAIILLVLSSARVALENVLKYGILIDPVAWLHLIVRDPFHWPNLNLCALLQFFLYVSLWLEKSLARKSLPESVGRACHVVNLVAILVVPSVTIWIQHPNPLFSSLTLAVHTVAFLKMESYRQVNKWCRQTQAINQRVRHKSISHDLDKLANQNGKISTLVTYPENLTMKDLYYFVCAPTLCYELNFPRSGRLRKRFLLKRLAEVVFLSGLIIALVQQWIVPTVNNSKVPFQQMDLPKVLERVLKLAVPNHLIWLLFFYWMFHSSLNVCAEILRFGDRVFYRDWWNAETVQNFWQNWNIPVHKWALRHLYKPLLQKGFTKMQASVTVFLASAFFHELLVSVPLRMLNFWAFMGMVMQIPMAIVTAKYLTGVWGNVAVWFSLIIGQPVAILMYYVDYYLITYNPAA